MYSNMFFSCVSTFHKSKALNSHHSVQIIPSTGHLFALSWNMGGKQMWAITDLWLIGNKCWATDLKLQNKRRLAYVPGGIKKDIWYYENIAKWIVSTDKNKTKHFLLACTEKTPNYITLKKEGIQWLLSKSPFFLKNNRLQKYFSGFCKLIVQAVCFALFCLSFCPPASKLAQNIWQAEIHNTWWTMNKNGQ